jgi:chromosomal replication initiation ATPase DnaA
LQQGHQVLTSSRHLLTDESLLCFSILKQYKIEELIDVDIKEALTLKAEERGLLVPADVEDLILIKVGHSMKKLVNILDKLEQRSDQEKKKITLTVLKSMFKELHAMRQDA